MHGQEIFQVFTDLNHSDLGLCTGYCKLRFSENMLKITCSITTRCTVRVMR